MKLETIQPIVIEEDHPSISVARRVVPVEDNKVESAQQQGVTELDSHAYFMNRTLSIVDQASKVNNGVAVEYSGNGGYPTVDVSSWMQMVDAASDPSLPTKEQNEVVDFILRQVTTVGSFNITGHGVSKDMMDRLDAASRAFFSLPDETKGKFYNGESKRGYIHLRQESVASVYGYKTKEKERRDLRECYSVVYPPEHPANASCPEEYRKVLNEYLEHMDRLDTALHLLFTAVLIKIKRATESKIPHDLLESAKGEAKGLFKATYYPILGDEYRGAVKLAAHSDWGTITIVHAPDHGLEEIRDGHWVKVPPTNAGELHVIVGEMIAIWTNLAFVNNVHRVNDPEGERASYVYFCGGQRESAGNQRGIAPVCSIDEAPRFGTVSFIDHTYKSLQKYRSG
jgi:isopenicillin N synthase-like dioxygenase